MYTKKIEIVNYGPISQLDIEFPFHGDDPKPIVLVGENGSGKSIFLSHIVNALAAVKGLAYPDSSEVESGKVYKLRSSSYIRLGSEWCYASIDFDDDVFMAELTLSIRKEEYGKSPPTFSSGRAQDTWNEIPEHESSGFISNIFRQPEAITKNLYDRNCLLYFPHNRFEEPAWLNEENLKAHAEFMDLKRLRGNTSRRLINYSSLRDNQNWLFGVVYDMTAFEMQIEENRYYQTSTNTFRDVSEWKGYSGSSTDVHSIVLELVRRIMGISDARFTIGGRLNRTLSLQSGEDVLVSNVFQLSSGETSLLNLFLSLLRDFDLSDTSFSRTDEVRGIVVVDEIDLHLHAVHQYDILPSLIQMFPKVQFIVTTHSPLFVLGMRKVFGEDGFALYRLPEGQQINPEEFSEFGNAYEAFKASVRFSGDLQQAIEQVQQPILYVEGSTDVKYLETAATLLGHNSVFNRIHILEGGGDNLKNVWKVVLSLPDQRVPNRIMVLRDCDYSGDNEGEGIRLRRKIPKLEDHPLEKGIENLFTKATLEKARSHKHAFIDVFDAHKETVRGNEQLIPEKWTVNRDEKTNLCNWLCENGTVEDFQHFEVVFDLLSELLEDEEATRA